MPRARRGPAAATGGGTPRTWDPFTPVGQTHPSSLMWARRKTPRHRIPSAPELAWRLGERTGNHPPRSGAMRTHPCRPTGHRIKPRHDPSPPIDRMTQESARFCARSQHPAVNRYKRLITPQAFQAAPIPHAKAAAIERERFGRSYAESTEQEPRNRMVGVKGWCGRGAHRDY